MNKWIVDVLVENLDSEDDSEDNQNDSAVVDILSDELQEKNNQIDKLHELLNQQQILSLNTQKEKEKLLIELDETSTDEPDRHFWSRWFK